MSKKEPIKESEETKDVTLSIENDPDGLGIDDPAEVLKQFEDPTFETEDEAVEPPETEGEEEEEESEEESEDESEESEEESEADETEEEETEEEQEDEKPSETDEVLKLREKLDEFQRKYAASTTEVQNKFLPMQKEFEALKSEQEKLMQERQEIADVLRSDEQLMELFVRTANNPDLATAQPSKPVVDKEILEAALKETLGEDTLQTINQMKEEKITKRISVIDEFEANHPGLTDEDRYKIAQMAGSIEAINKSDLKTALDSAYLALYPDKAIESKREEMEKAAKINAIKNREATSSRTTSGTSKSKQPTISAQEKMIAHKMGLSPEEYVNNKI